MPHHTRQKDQIRDKEIKALINYGNSWQAREDKLWLEFAISEHMPGHIPTDIPIVLRVEHGKYSTLPIKDFE